MLKFVIIMYKLVVVFNPSQKLQNGMGRMSSPQTKIQNQTAAVSCSIRPQPSIMNTDHNPYLRKLDQIRAAQKQFDESEWRLFFLRTQSAQPTPSPDDHDLCKLFPTPTSLDWN